MNKIENGKASGWPEIAVIHTDGASRGNPGPASVGIVVYSEAGDEVYSCGESLGDQTNNYAEYMAVKMALEMAHSKGVRHLILRSDSQLLVRQLTGEYKVKAENLKPLYKECRDIAQQMDRVDFEHVRRELNKRADQMANEVLDL